MRAQRGSCLGRGRAELTSQAWPVTPCGAASVSSSTLVSLEPASLPFYFWEKQTPPIQALGSRTVLKEEGTLVCLGDFKQQPSPRQTSHLYPLNPHQTSEAGLTSQHLTKRKGCCICLKAGAREGRDISLQTKISRVKAMVFPEVMHGCES